MDHTHHRETERRISVRRLNDKKLTAELSREQLTTIAKLAIEIAKEDTQRDLGEFVLNTGKNLVKRVLFLIGCMVVYILASAYPVNLRHIISLLG